MPIILSILILLFCGNGVVLAANTTPVTQPIQPTIVQPEYKPGIPMAAPVKPTAVVPEPSTPTLVPVVPQTEKPIEPTLVTKPMVPTTPTDNATKVDVPSENNSATLDTEAYEKLFVTTISKRLESAMEGCMLAGFSKSFTMTLEVDDKGRTKDITMSDTGSDLNCVKNKLIGVRGPQPPFSPILVHIDMDVSE